MAETFDRQGEFPDIPEYYRKKILDAGMLDMGRGKGAMHLDDERVEACRDGREYCAKIVEKCRMLLKGIKDNGREETP